MYKQLVVLATTAFQKMQIEVTEFWQLHARIQKEGSPFQYSVMSFDKVPSVDG